MVRLEHLRRNTGRATLRLRVALITACLAIGALGTLGYIAVSTTSTAFTTVARSQSVTLTTQLASALVGNGPALAQLIPFSHQGLDGVVLFDAAGRPTSVGGQLGPTLSRLGREAAAVARSGRTVSQFRLPEAGGRSTRVSDLSPWSPGATLVVTIAPRPEGGAAAVGFHTRWATDVLRQRLISTALSLAGAILFVCCGLVLLLGRLVTRPVARLATEVRHLGERDMRLALTEPRAPELGQLARDISRMRDELLDAVVRSSTDPLTGIANHRAFHERLDEEVERSRLTGEALALVVLDLDDLKRINDSYGHMAGDRVLEAIAAGIASACRAEDLCARIGGDEFAIVCPRLDSAGAAAIGERVMAAVAALPAASLLGAHDDGVDLALSLSFGVGSLPACGQTKEELIHAADNHLYAAKSGSRSNSSALVEPEPLPEAIFRQALDEREPESR